MLNRLAFVKGRLFEFLISKNRRQANNHLKKMKKANKPKTLNTEKRFGVANSEWKIIKTDKALKWRQVGLDNQSKITPFL